MKPSNLPFLTFSVSYHSSLAPDILGFQLLSLRPSGTSDDPSDQSFLPMKHTIYNPSKPSFKVPRCLREAPSGLSQTKLVSLCRCVLSRI